MNFALRLRFGTELWYRVSFFPTLPSSTVIGRLLSTSTSVCHSTGASSAMAAVRPLSDFLSEASEQGKRSTTVLSAAHRNEMVFVQTLNDELTDRLGSCHQPLPYPTKVFARAGVAKTCRHHAGADLEAGG